jgi:hypothetical protein
MRDISYTQSREIWSSARVITTILVVLAAGGEHPGILLVRFDGDPT